MDNEDKIEYLVISFKIIIMVFQIYLTFKYKSDNIFLKDKISVIIPTYNREESIIDSINSVLRQTYDNLEIIIIDDGSTDKTESLIANLNDNRIKYIKLNGNKGASFARNEGIKIASGKYITFQDSDDLYHLDKIERQYKNLIKKKSDFDFCMVCLHFNKSFEVIFPREYQHKKIVRKKILEELCNGNFISTQSIFIKKEVIKNYLFDINFQRLQDYDLVLRILPKHKVSYSKKVLVDLYRKKDSIGRDNKKLNQSFHLLSLKKYNINCKNNSFLSSPLNFSLNNL
jgi:glycosyltransferase involved in cell wall biosynthesis